MIFSKHFVILGLILGMWNASLIAQYHITGTLVDAETEAPLIGGNLKLIATIDSVVYFGASDYKGNFKIKVLKKGVYNLEVSYISYQSFKKEIRVNGDLDLGAIHLHFNSINLNEIEVTATQARVIQRGDTTQFNANAYQANPNATTEDLLQKMPGFVVTNGKMEVQGEKVAKVLINGKPFFGDDPNVALKNLPAEAIATVKVFDKKKEVGEEEQTSEEDSQKTINIVLKKSYNNRTFGHAYGGLGTDNRYKINANINIFKGNRRVNILAQFNNINQQNFSTADLLGVTTKGENTQSGVSSRNFLVPRKGGINTTNAVGLNYQDFFSDKVEISGSYFFNQSQNINQISETRNYFNRGSPFLIAKEADNNSKNINHRLNAKVLYRINEQNSILITPHLTFQQNAGQYIDSIQTFSNNELTNTLSNVFNSNLTAFRFSNRLTFTHQFKKPSRSINISIRNKISASDGTNFTNAFNINTTTITTTEINQNSILDNAKQSYSINIHYQEPLSKSNKLTLSYTFGNETNNADILTSSYNAISENFDLLEKRLSTVFNTDYQSHRGELSYQYKKEKLNIKIGGSAQFAYLGNQQTFPKNIISNNVFRTILPNILVKYQINKSKHLRFRIKSRTRLPRVSDLQNVINNSDPLRVRLGNPNLKQQVGHSIQFKYSVNNPKKNSTFYIFLQSNIYDNFLGHQLTIFTNVDTIRGVILQPDAQLRTPINLSGFWSNRLFTSYGIPLLKIKSNFNINLGIEHRQIPSRLNGEMIFTHNEKLKIGAALSSNISKSIDFTIRTTTNFNFAQNALFNTQIFNQNTKATINYIFAKHWQINTQITHRFYHTFENAPIDDFFLWNASFQYRFLKDQKAELGITIFDLLNSNITIQQRYNGNYYLQREALNLRRYVMFNFRYRM